MRYMVLGLGYQKLLSKKENMFSSSKANTRNLNIQKQLSILLAHNGSIVVFGNNGDCAKKYIIWTLLGLAKDSERLFSGT